MRNRATSRWKRAFHERADARKEVHQYGEGIARKGSRAPRERTKVAPHAAEHHEKGDAKAAEEHSIKAHEHSTKAHEHSTDAHSNSKVKK